MSGCVPHLSQLQGLPEDFNPLLEDLGQVALYVACLWMGCVCDCVCTSVCACASTYARVYVCANAYVCTS